MIKVVIVDDERRAREVVETMLLTRDDVLVAGTASNGAQAIDVIKREKPDLVFLDIEMPDGDGFQVLEGLGEELPRGVVFVTAHDEYAVRAFEVHALDYILKPFGKPRFDEAVGRAIERLKLATSLQPTIDVVRRIPVKSGSRTMLLDTAEVRWIEASDDYVRLHTATQSYLLDQRMSEMERTLDPREFMRIHRSCIVRLGAVKELHRESDGGGAIIIEGGVRLRVARSKWDRLAKALWTGQSSE
jgi:two-component system LytT family response regulator